MNNTSIVESHSGLNVLEHARALQIPSRQEMLVRAPSVKQFWDDNRDTLANAWQAWEVSSNSDLTIPNDSLLDKRLYDAVNEAWENPKTESNVKDLWQEVAPGVFMAQFFDPEKLVSLRNYLAKVADAQIPLRPPYGIALNRHGAMLDPRSEGFLAAPGFQAFYQQLLDKYMRPVARLLFPEITGYDTQTFGFSIQWQAGMDTSLRPHTDASAATMNINMNLPGEVFTGSEVDFYDAITGKATRLSF